MSFEANEDSARVVITRVRGGGLPTSPEETDEVAREEPLELQVNGASVAVVMRTPGHDEELALGFLLSERIVADPGAVHSIRHCTRAPSPQARDNVIQVRLQEGLAVDLAALRRNLYASSSCGVCGKASIDNVMGTAPPLEDPAVASVGWLRQLPAKLRLEQRVFERTGGLHGVGLFAAQGELVVAREDVGRHNAVDKVLGHAAASGLWPLSLHALVVSGRVSFEVVQKALAARIPIIAAVSAPTSLAVELAKRSNIALVGFVRGESMNVYSAPHRIGA